MNKAISTENSPAAIGPYSQGIKAGNFVFISGQLPIDHTTGDFAGIDIASQTKKSLENVCAILKEAKMAAEDVIKTTVFLSDMNNFAEMNKIYATFFKKPYPSRVAVEVAKLPKDALVEIEAIAFKE